MYTIMIVEDDPVIASALSRQLERWNYQVFYTAEFDTIDQQVRKQQPDLILMDITLPSFSGYYWCTEIRKFSRVPIVFLSSASDEMNQVMALSMGGDDFIAKPFSMDYAVAKIGAVLRRTYEFTADSLSLHVGDVTLDLGEAAVLHRGQKLALSKNEFLILRTLFEHKNTPVSRDTLIRRLWDDESFIDDNTLTVNIARIRKKLEEIGLGELIKTRKGLGYLVEEEHHA